MKEEYADTWLFLISGILFFANIAIIEIGYYYFPILLFGIMIFLLMTIFV